VYTKSCTHCHPFSAHNPFVLILKPVSIPWVHSNFGLSHLGRLRLSEAENNAAWNFLSFFVKIQHVLVKFKDVTNKRF